jgi:transposase-like protein
VYSLKANKEYCPYCNSDLQGEPIPEQSQKAYGATHFTRKLGITSIEGDRIIMWKCPDCNEEWNVE